jgi:hypothetical protein
VPDPRLQAPGTIPPVANAGLAGASNVSGSINSVKNNLGSNSTAGDNYFSYELTAPQGQNNGYTQDITGIPSYSEPSVTGEIPPATGFVTTPASTNYLPTQTSTTLVDSSLTASVQEGSNEAAIFGAPDLTGQANANVVSSLVPTPPPAPAISAAPIVNNAPVLNGPVSPVSNYTTNSGTAQYLNYLA